MVKRLQLMYILVAAVAIGIFLCRNVKEKYVNKQMRKILNDIKMKEREGQSI